LVGEVRCSISFLDNFADMSRRWIYFAVFFFAAFLSACTFVTSTPTPTAVPALSSPYDGPWAGSGVAQDGRKITIQFTIQGGAISSFTYIYLRPDNIPCTGIDHNVIPADSRPHITDNSFSQVFGP
jgi:hypothetical protein